MPKFFFLILVITLSQLLSGCTTSPGRTAEEFIDAGHSYVNHIRLSGQQLNNLETYGRVSGDTEHSVPVSELIKVQSMSGDQFEGGIYVPAQFKSAGAPFEVQSENTADFLRAAINVMDSIIGQLPDVNELNPYIRIVSAPGNSGVSVQTEQSLDTLRSVPITFVVSMDSEQASAGFGWWKSVLEVAAHELLHLQHKLSPPVPKGTEVDRETAAYLYGQCAVSRMAKNLGAFSLEVGIELNHSAWSDIESGRYSPRMEKIKQIGNSSQQGRTLALGYLYHLVPGGAVDLLDERVEKELLATCDSLPASIPHFSRGLD